MGPATYCSVDHQAGESFRRFSPCEHMDQAILETEKRTHLGTQLLHVRGKDAKR